jgi:hypothetical protein
MNVNGAWRGEEICQRCAIREAILTNIFGGSICTTRERHFQNGFR